MRSGRELSYLNAAGRMTVAPVETTGRFAVGSAVSVSTKTYATAVAWRSYDVTADGRRFLVLKESADAAPPAFVVVQNWFQELRAKLR